MKDLIDRQAAIDGLMKRDKALRNINWYDKPYAEGECKGIDEALDIISALPSAQPEPCDDAVSRDKMLETYANIYWCDDRTIANKEDMDRIYDKLKALPSVQPDIIHCKDCKHWMPYDWMFSEVWQSKNMDDYPEDEIGCAYCDMNMGANDFCSRPEKKTDER